MPEKYEKYRGTGAAGALVYLNKGKFVSQSDIWDKKTLKPGSSVQVWRRTSDFELLKKNRVPKSWGTAAVYIKYIDNNTIRVLHFNSKETWKKSKFGFFDRCESSHKIAGEYINEINFEFLENQVG